MADTPGNQKGEPNRSPLHALSRTTPPGPGHMYGRDDLPGYKKLPPPPWLYLVTDREPAPGRALARVVEQAIQGGVNFVQYREKQAGTREMLAEARELAALCRQYNVPFVVNDRVDIALAVSADGVHLGQSDMPLEVARQILGPRAVIGISASSVAEAAKAARGGADYLGASAVFATPTKTDAPALGIRGTADICRAVPVPVVAIGGLNAANAGEVMTAGVAGIAVVSAIMASSDPREAARRLKQACLGGAARA